MNAVRRFGRALLRAPGRAQSAMMLALFGLLAVPAFAFAQTSDFDGVQAPITAKIGEVVPIGIAVFATIIAVVVGIKLLRRLIGS